MEKRPLSRQASNESELRLRLNAGQSRAQSCEVTFVVIAFTFKSLSGLFLQPEVAEDPEQHATFNPRDMRTPSPQPDPQPSVVVNEEADKPMRFRADHVVQMFLPVTVSMLIVLSTLKTVDYYAVKDANFTYFDEDTDSIEVKIVHAILNSEFGVWHSGSIQT